jgi:hypothetical protein
MVNKLVEGSEQDQAYRGYYMTFIRSNGMFSISKDNFHIGYAKSVEEAKKIIDQLV